MNGPNEVVKETTVALSITDSFKSFTSEIGEWWPKNHTRSGETASVFLETNQDGRFYERNADGDEFSFGVVTLWDPPHRFVMDWYMGSGVDNPSEVTIVFVSTSPNSTTITITHRGYEKIGDIWWNRIALFEKGWTHGLESFSEHVVGVTS